MGNSFLSYYFTLSPTIFFFSLLPKQAHQTTLFQLLCSLQSNPPLPTPGWRNQIPSLLSLSYRIVCPDLIGFGRTAAPPVSPPYNTNTNIQYYSFKRAASDIAELARLLDCQTIILGGHDWVRNLISIPSLHFRFRLQPLNLSLFRSFHLSFFPRASSNPASPPRAEQSSTASPSTTPT